MRLSLLLVLCAAACDAFDDRYDCTDDSQCADPARPGVSGRCISGACAFSDPGCGSGYRFDPSAGPDLGGTCVSPDMTPVGGAGFHLAPLPQGQHDAATLSVLFGPPDGSTFYVGGRDGQPLLWRRDPGGLTGLTAPPGVIAPVAGVAGPAPAGPLAVAQGDATYLSQDQGMTWAAAGGTLGPAQALYHDGQQLYGLVAGAVWILSAAAPVQDFSPDTAHAHGVALFGSGATVMLLAGTDAGTGVVYRRQGGWQVVSQVAAPLSAGWLGHDGTWLAAGAGVLLRNGAQVSPAPDSAPSALAGGSENDLWAIGPGWSYVLHRVGPAWQQEHPDPVGTGYPALWAGHPAGDLAKNQVVVVSTFPAGLTYRSRLWTLP